MGNIIRAEAMPTNIILNPDEASIEEYAEALGSIWPQDKEMPIWLHWIHVLSHATAVCEEVRKNRWHKVARELAAHGAGVCKREGVAGGDVLDGLGDRLQCRTVLRNPGNRILAKRMKREPRQVLRHQTFKAYVGSYS